MAKLIVFLIVLSTLSINSCCSNNDHYSEDEIFMVNNSEEPVTCIISFYLTNGHDLMMTSVNECLPNEKLIFRMGRHDQLPIAVKVYKKGSVDFSALSDFPVQPLASYIFTIPQLRKHNWTFTYPPSEEWMQSGIKEIGIN